MSSNSSSIVVCVSVAAEICLPTHSLATAISSVSIILAFIPHVTI
jgi:hypothetical protein